MLRELSCSVPQCLRGLYVLVVAISLIGPRSRAVGCQGAGRSRRGAHSRAAGGGRSPRRPGAHGLRRSAQARDRSRDQAAGGREDRARAGACHRRPRREPQRAAEGARGDARRADTRVKERLVEMSKRGRGGYVQLLLASNDVRALGRMARGVAAVAETRSRAARHASPHARRRTRRAHRARSAARRRSTASSGGDARARRGRRGRGGAQPADRRSRSAARPGGAVRRPSCRQAQAELERTIASAGTGVAGGRAADPALPRRPAVAGHRRGGHARSGGSPAGRFGTTIVRNGIEISAAEGTTGHGRARRHRRLCGAVQRLRHAGHRRSRQIGLHALRPFAGGDGHARDERQPRRRRSGASALAPSGGAALYFELRIDGRPVDPATMAAGDHDEDSRPRSRSGGVDAGHCLRRHRRVHGQGDRARRQLSVPAHLRRRRHADHQQLRRGSERRQGDARRDARPGRRPRSRQRLSRRQPGEGARQGRPAAARHRPASS